MEEKEGERKAEKMGSEARESRAEEEGVVVAVEAAAEEGFLKVERRCIGDAPVETGVLAAAGDAIVIFVFASERRRSFSLVLVQTLGLDS